MPKSKPPKIDKKVKLFTTLSITFVLSMLYFLDVNFTNNLNSQISSVEITTLPTHNVFLYSPSSLTK